MSPLRATVVLMEEHRVIERVLAALETAAERLRAGDPIDPSFFLRASDFVKGFADGCHHQKEEGVLFPALESAGLPREGGPVGVMLEEHEEGRELNAGMRAGAERVAAGDASARDEIARCALDYVALLRAHIAKEDRVLFRMADEMIRGQAQDAMMEDFERVEREEAASGVPARYLALAASLEREMARP
jgi:hemerythrin-like domain-containing protein